MRSSRIAVVIAIVITSSIPALAFYPSGRINDDLSYSDIQVSKHAYNPKISGVITNNSDHSVKVNGKILFCTIHKEVINSASIYETVPPRGYVRFDRYLENSNHRDAFQIIWEIKDYSEPKISKHSFQQNEETKSIASATTRASEKFIKVVGNGKHNSNQFALRTGLYIVKVSHTGKRHCGIKLLHGNGEYAELIANGIGYIVESKAVRIDEDGYYLIDVSADGEWTVSMEYQEQKTPNNQEVIDQTHTTANANNSAKPVQIKLKSGRIIKADSCWEDGNKIKISIYGGTMSYDKEEIQEIIRTNSPAAVTGK